MSGMIQKQQRRKILKVLGSGAVLSSLYGVSGCSGEKEPAAPAARAEPTPAPEVPAPTANEPAAAAGESSNPTSLEALSEDDPQAKALSYVDDASDINAERFPQFEAGQLCSNCALYLGEDGSMSGPCSIFPGKSVQASGWCSVYAPKA